MTHLAKKRKCMSIELKIDILREVKKEKLNKGEISAKYNIPPSTLPSIVSTKEQICMEFFNASFAPGRKKLRGAKYVCGEAGSEPDEIVNKWKRLKRIICSHCPEDFFDVNETQIFFNLTPEKAMLYLCLDLKVSENYELKVTLDLILCTSLPSAMSKEYRSGIGGKRSKECLTISPDNIANCFRKAGFCHDESTQEETDVAPAMEIDNVWEEIASQLQADCEFTQFVNFDEDIPMCKPLPNSAMCAETHGAMEQEDAVNKEEMEEEP
ncbi:unnamed protein product, partial [Darwinula stevensoni]